MNRPACDLCSESYPSNRIKISRTPNGEEVILEICDHCLTDVKKYIEATNE